MNYSVSFMCAIKDFVHAFEVPHSKCAREIREDRVRLKDASPTVFNIYCGKFKSE